jgi:hypothetical protein
MTRVVVLCSVGFGRKLPDRVPVIAATNTLSSGAIDKEWRASSLCETALNSRNVAEIFLFRTGSLTQNLRRF